jgi:hypothetical protein
MGSNNASLGGDKRLNWPRFAQNWAAGGPVLLALALLLIAGCDSEQIDHYSIPKPEAIAQRHGIEPGEHEPKAPAEPVPTRMLAAVVLHGGEGWFFKLMGPPKAVREQAAAFRKFVESVHFVRSLPKWEIPAGWREEPGTARRFATIRVPAAERSLELTVVNLPKAAGDDEQYLLANINRWRGQLGLPDVDLAELPKQISAVKLKEGEATLVDFEGESAAGGGMGGPFGGGGFAGGPFSGRARVPMAGNRAADGRAPHPPMSGGVADFGPGHPSPITFETPTGWVAGPSDRMRKAAFGVGDEEKHALITVIDLGPEAGSLLANVNRWRGQLQLPPITEGELPQEVRHLPVDGQRGDYVELKSSEGTQPRQAMLAVMVPHGGKKWFIKMVGDGAIVEREKPHFEAFVRSLRLGPQAAGTQPPDTKPADTKPPAAESPATKPPAAGGNEKTETP